MGRYDKTRVVLYFSFQNVEDSFRKDPYSCWIAGTNDKINPQNEGPIIVFKFVRAEVLSGLIQTFGFAFWKRAYNRPDNVHDSKILSAGLTLLVESLKRLVVVPVDLDVFVTLVHASYLVDDVVGFWGASRVAQVAIHRSSC